MIITTTYPNLQKAKKLARILLEEKLAACVQFLEIESCYIWEEKVAEEKEVLVIIKTKSELFQEIEGIIKNNHDYKIPQIIGTRIDKGSQSYLNWIASNVKNAK